MTPLYVWARVHRVPDFALLPKLPAVVQPMLAMCAQMAQAADTVELRGGVDLRAHGRPKSGKRTRQTSSKPAPEDVVAPAMAGAPPDTVIIPATRSRGWWLKVRDQIGSPAALTRSGHPF